MRSLAKPLFRMELCATLAAFAPSPLTAQSGDDDGGSHILIIDSGNVIRMCDGSF
jgi:hypothetical protein